MADEAPKKAQTKVCTDVCCALLFYAWLGGMGAIQYYAVQNGNLDKLTHGFNWQNEICGVSERVKDMPMLFWCPPDDATGVGWNMADGVCLPSCPTSEERALCPGPSHQFHLNISEGNGVFNIVSGVNRTLTSRNTYASTPAGFYCFPDTTAETGAALAASFTAQFGNTSSAMAAMEGVRDSKAFFSGVAVFAILLGYAFMYFLDKFVGLLIQMMVLIVWLGLLVVGGGFGYVGYCATDEGACDEQVTGSLDDYVSRENLPMVGYGVGGTVGVLWLVYSVVVCCCMRKALAQTIEALEGATKLIRTMPTLLLLPVIQTLFKIIILCVLVMGMCWVVSLGEPSPVVISEAGASVAGVGRHFAYTDNEFYALIFFAFGCLWLIETTTALGQYVISYVVVSRVENHTHHMLPLMHGYMNCLMFHVGTIAFGGFVLGALRFVSALMAIFMKVTSDKEGNQSAVAKCLCCCCMCCMECITDATELLNELVYTDVAIRGSSYMTSAKNVVAMALTNPGTYGGVKFATEILGFLGVGGLTFIGTYLPYLILTNPSVLGTSNDLMAARDQQSQMACTVVTFLISFFTSMAFMTSFNQCALAMMYIDLYEAEQEKQNKEGYEKLEGSGEQ